MSDTFLDGWQDARVEPWWEAPPRRRPAIDQDLKTTLGVLAMIVVGALVLGVAIARSPAGRPARPIVAPARR